MFCMKLFFCHLDKGLFRYLGVITTVLLAILVIFMLLNSIYLGLISGKIGEVMVFGPSVSVAFRRAICYLIKFVLPGKYLIL